MYKDTGVTAVCLHPGFVRSEIMRTNEHTSLSKWLS